MLKVTKGFFWSAVDYVSVQAIQFFISIIIARLVAPSAYGVIVMVQVFVSFAQLFIDSGLKNALIQKKDRTDIDFYTMFIFNLGVALFFYAVLFIVAPYIADFYNQPVLADLTRVIGLSMVLSSLSITQLARLQILLDFKTQAKARVLSVIISGIIGIGCAYHGMEVWALAIQGVVYNPQIQISAESETKRSIFREKDKTKRSKKESAQHSKSRNKSFVMTSVSAL